MQKTGEQDEAPHSGKEATQRHHNSHKVQAEQAAN
jgi:hypothetical protein